MALWAAAGLASAGALLAWLSPPVLPLPVTAPGSSSQSGSQSALLQLFGANANFQKTPEAKDVRLIGVLAGSEQGAVLVSIASGPVRQLSLGKVEPDGWTLLQMDPDQALLGHHGNTVALKVPRSKGF